MGMHGRKTSGYLQLITAGREATDRGVFGRKLKGLELTACVKELNVVPCKKIVNKKKIGNARNNIYIQGDSFGTRPKKMRISQRLFIRF